MRITFVNTPRHYARVWVTWRGFMFWARWRGRFVYTSKAWKPYSE